MISTVIPYYNDPMLEDCFDALKSNLKGMDSEIIVVDNRGSSDPLPIDPDVVISNDANVGYTRATNQGVEKSRGDLILLLNADAVLNPGCVERMAELLLSDELFGLVSPAELKPDGVLYDIPDSIRSNKIREQHSTYQIIQWVCFGCVLLKRSTVEKVGMLNESFPHRWSDLEYCKRVNKSGMKVVYVYDVSYVHWRRSSDESEIHFYPSFIKGEDAISNEKVVYEFLMDLLIKNGMFKSEENPCKSIRMKRMVLPSERVIRAIKAILGQKITINSIFDDQDYTISFEDADLKKNVVIFEGRRDKPNLYIRGC